MFVSVMIHHIIKSCVTNESSQTKFFNFLSISQSKQLHVKMFILSSPVQPKAPGGNPSKVLNLSVEVKIKCQ